MQYTVVASLLQSSAPGLASPVQPWGRAKWPGTWASWRHWACAQSQSCTRREASGSKIRKWNQRGKKWWCSKSMAKCCQTDADRNKSWKGV